MVGRLRALWAEGLSASQIAAELNSASRNAVLGKLNRLDLLKRNRPKKEKAAHVPKAPGTYLGPNNVRKVVRAAPQSRLGVISSVPVIPVSKRVALIDLEFGQCRWPEGDPHESDFGFCGRPQHTPFDGFTQYCAAHNAVAYAPRKQRTRPTKA